MKSFCLRIFVVLILFSILLSSCKDSDDSLVLAFYYLWYSSDANTTSWDLAVDKPELGHYSSKDREIIDKHLKWMKYAGIDGVIISWWGIDTESDINYKLLLNAVRENKSKIKVIPYIEDVQGHTINELRESLKVQIYYILENYAIQDEYLRIDGLPVIFLYARLLLKLDHNGIADVIKEMKQDRQFWVTVDIGNPTNEVDRLKIPEIDNFHTYEPVWMMTHGHTSMETYQFMSETSLERSYFLSVIPGYTDAHIPERVNPMTLEPQNGILFRELLEQTKEFSPIGVLITSFNEWYERTAIEPSVENGDVYLDILRDVY